MGRIKPPKTSGFGKISAPQTTSTDHNALKVVFGFQYVVKGFDLRSGSGGDASNFVEALRLRSSITWAQVIGNSRTALGYERISTSLIVKPPASVPAEQHDNMVSFRFGDNKERFIGYRSGATFEVVWIDHAGECYKH